MKRIVYIRPGDMVDIRVMQDSGLPHTATAWKAQSHPEHILLRHRGNKHLAYCDASLRVDRNWDDLLPAAQLADSPTPPTVVLESEKSATENADDFDGFINEYETRRWPWIGCRVLVKLSDGSIGTGHHTGGSWRVKGMRGSLPGDPTAPDAHTYLHVVGWQIDEHNLPHPDTVKAYKQGVAAYHARSEAVVQAGNGMAENPSQTKEQ
ncbi:hypothetical protein F6X40_10290 [Paraburkholderia sp. UCT31]|uniref:hypothetical protein n=1 Tax=Paraburkholderia sp. UCT31 TaxID=2615209 RepID=UPI001655397F|nr:hypothetical protein [Paraburkholderia sp. UCT31]MBC8737197.1 hypothetical protein [Paraburkholderia sp. UCT31]